MKRLLRSVIDFSGITQENLILNFQKLSASGLNWGRPDDERIYQFLQQHFQAHLELPSSQTVLDYFTSANDVEATERIKDIQAAEGPYYRSNYNALLRNILEEQNKIRAVALLKETQEIVTKGLVVDKEKKAGLRDGLMHFTQRANDLITSDLHTTKLRGDIRLDGQTMVDSYVKAEANKDKVWGKFSGIEQIDTVCRGSRKGELWVHAAFTGELKSTFAVNWCYNLVTHYKANVVYFSLEMPYEQLRMQSYVLHSANMKWVKQGRKPLDYRQVRDGMLTPEEKDFYLREVIPDFSNNPEYCHFEVIHPDTEVTMDDIRLQAELLHKKFEVGLIVIDHGQYVEPRKARRNKDYTVELNSIVRDCKQRLALNFNHGEGVPVLLLWQINRDGKDEADKNDGIYKMKALTYANETEKSADVITTSYLNDDHRRNGTTKFCNLKNRDNPLFEPFLARVDFPCRRIVTIDKLSTPSQGMSAEYHESVLSMGEML